MSDYTVKQDEVMILIKKFLSDIYDIDQSITTEMELRYTGKCLLKVPSIKPCIVSHII